VTLTLFYIVQCNLLNIKLKVLFVLPSKISITGSSIAVINIMIGLLKNNVEVYVIATKPPKEYEIFLTRLEKKGAKLFIISSEKSGYRYWKLLASNAMEIMKKFDIPLIHLHLPKLMYFLGNDLKKMKKKIVFTVEGDPIYEVKKLGFITRWKTNRMWKKSLSYADYVCPCSNWLKDLIVKRDKVKKIFTVHNSIDIEKFQNPNKISKNELNVSEKDFVVMTAARLTLVKDIETLLKGFSLFVKKGKKNSSLIILGDGELKEKLIDMTKKLKIENLVNFVGFKNNPQDFIASADVFVMTSKYEPFGMPAAEAGCMKIPTIVSKAGGMMEIIIHGKTGFQFNIGDQNELALYLDQLYNDKEMRMNFARNANEHISSNFAPKVISQKFIKIYQELIQTSN